MRSVASDAFFRRARISTMHPEDLQKMDQSKRWEKGRVEKRKRGRKLKVCDIACGY